jgi:hypothetical protein
MYKLAAAVTLALSLAACGGGGSDSTPAPTVKHPTLSFYGNPLGATVKSTAKAAASDAASAAAPVSASDAAAETVQSLTDALAAQGVTANVTAQVMDGTTLHAIVMGENNGLPPTPDQFKTDPSEWLIVNFTLDDMVSTIDVPSQAASLAQFQQDLTVFIQRGHVSGKNTFIVMPIQSCDASPVGFSATEGLRNAITQAAIAGFAFQTGLGAGPIVVGPDGRNVDTLTAGHMGEDCRTPDAYLLNLRTQAVAADIANRLKLTAEGK